MSSPQTAFPDSLGEEIGPWPEVDSHRVVFLLDFLTPTERTILLEDIVRHAPEGRDYRCVDANVRAPKLSESSMEQLCALFIEDADTYFVPVRVSWRPRQQKEAKTASFRDVLAGDSDNPGPLRQRFLHRRRPRCYRVLAGRGAGLEELQRNLAREASSEKGNERNLAAYVLKSALLSLEKAERPLKGARYKLPHMVADSVLATPRVTEGLAQIARDTGRPMEDLEKEARSCLREIAPTHTALGLELGASLGRFMYSRGFDPQIDVDSEDLERIRTLMSEKPVAFLMTHKSHIDGFLLIALFHDQDFTPLHSFGGINMNFLGFGSLAKRAGMIFLRRSFDDQPVYKLIFKSYIDYLGRNRFPLMWALEGTRSRTGKLVPPRYGLLNYVISAYLRDNAPDLLLLPISIMYDQVPEVGDYDAMQAGEKKRPESASWFMQYVSGLKHPHGKIHVRFGRGVSLSEVIDMAEHPSTIDDRTLQKIAFRLSVDANSVMPITPTALITFVMLSHGHTAVTRSELQCEIESVVRHVITERLPATLDLKDWSDSALELTLRNLKATGIVEEYDDGLEPVYAIAPDQGRSAAYYRNGMLHFLLPAAIAEFAVVGIDHRSPEEPLEQFRSNVLKLRDVLKFEFFFAESDEFLRSVEDSCDRRAPLWREALAQGKDAMHALLTDMDSPVLGHAALRPFLEAYLLLAECLTRIPPDEGVNSKKLVSQSLLLGKQKVRQRRINCEESVSVPLFENALKLAEIRGLCEPGSDALAAREALHQELGVLVTRARLLDSLGATKRITRLQYQLRSAEGTNEGA